MRNTANRDDPREGVFRVMEGQEDDKEKGVR